MGFKIAPEFGPLPAGLRDGILYSERKDFPEVKLPDELKELEMPTQLNSYVESNIKFCLRNDKVILLGFFDGSLALYNKRGIVIHTWQPNTVSYPLSMAYYLVIARRDGGCLREYGNNYQTSLLKLANGKICLFIHKLNYIAYDIYEKGSYINLILSGIPDFAPSLIYDNVSSEFRTLYNDQQDFIACNEVLNKASIILSERWLQHGVI